MRIVKRVEKNNKYNGKTCVLGVKNLKGMLPVTQTRPNQSDQGSNTNKKNVSLPRISKVLVGLGLVFPCD